MKVDSDINRSWSPLNKPEEPGKKTRETGEERRPSRPQHFCNQLEFIKNSGKPEETCSQSDFSEKPPVKTDMKNSHRPKLMRTIFPKKPFVIF